MKLEIIIIGAGPAGLAMAGRLKHIGVEALILEKSSAVGNSWRNHYDRLHLHTVNEFSHFPHLEFPSEWSNYISKNQLVEYMDNYVLHFDLSVNFNQSVSSVEKKGSKWLIKSNDQQLTADVVIMATGYNNYPVIPDWPNREAFTGEFLHSKVYKNATAFQGKKVLVVGMGNTGAEIALDLCENGAFPKISIRDAINIVPRDFRGRPTQRTAMLLRKLPVWLGDQVGVLLRSIAVGDLSPWGIQTPKEPPAAQLRKYGKTPVIDIGTVARIKSGDIKVVGPIRSFFEKGVVYANSEREEFHAVILATGYKASLDRIVKIDSENFGEKGEPKDAISQLAGLYFLGFDTTYSGILNAIFVQSERIFEDLQVKFRPSAS